MSKKGRREGRGEGQSVRVGACLFLDVYTKHNLYRQTGKKGGTRGNEEERL